MADTAVSAVALSAKIEKGEGYWLQGSYKTFYTSETFVMTVKIVFLSICRLDSTSTIIFYFSWDHYEKTDAYWLLYFISKSPSQCPLKIQNIISVGQLITFFTLNEIAIKQLGLQQLLKFGLINKSSLNNP